MGISFHIGYLCTIKNNRFLNSSAIFIQYESDLVTIARKMVRNQADAEDIVQDTFLKWLTIGPENIANTKAYLYKAVKNNCLNHIKWSQRRNYTTIDEFESDFPTAEESVSMGIDFELEIQKALRFIVQKLEPLERSVFLLKEVFNFDYDDLQEVLEKKKDNCRQMLCRARKKLSDATTISLETPHWNDFVSNFRNACNLNNGKLLLEFAY